MAKSTLVCLILAAILFGGVGPVFGEDEFDDKPEEETSIVGDLPLGTTYALTADEIADLKAAQSTGQPTGGRRKKRALADPFDARTHLPWQNCRSIGKVWNQGPCGSCWAIAAASVLTDRFCIAYGGTTNVYISASQAAGCSYRRQTPKQNCDLGGHAEIAYLHAMNYGLPTGGRFGKGGCAPYLASTWQNVLNLVKPGTIECRTSCSSSSRIMDRDKLAISGNWMRFEGLMPADIPNRVNEIKQQILDHGPVSARIEVFDDFPKWNFEISPYVKGVNAKALGGGLTNGAHAVRILGWDTHKNGMHYWIVANSWGKKWGLNGIFWIQLGVNMVGIEGLVTAPIINDPNPPVNCDTASFCGHGQLDQVVPTNISDPGAPIYLLKGECAQKVTYEGDRLVTKGPAVPKQWVFPTAPNDRLTRYKLVESGVGQDKVVNMWLYNAANDGVACRRVADNKFKCPRMQFNAVIPILAPDAGASVRAMYYDDAMTLQSLAYDDHSLPPHLTKMNGDRVPCPNLLDKTFATVDALYRVNAKKLAAFGTTGGVITAVFLDYQAATNSYTLDPRGNVLTCAP